NDIDKNTILAKKVRIEVGTSYCQSDVMGLPVAHYKINNENI
ncbi:unnamed protein product, partial [Allacma fusca]